MEFNGASWSLMKFNGVYRSSMEFNGALWSLLELNGV